MAAQLNHLGLPATDLDRSIAFYEHWTSMTVKDSGESGDIKGARMSDSDGGFALSLFEMPAARFPQPQPMLAHIGFSCEEREEVDQLAKDALDEGILLSGPSDSDDGVGYQALILEPDGYTVEFSSGQQFGLSG